MIPNRSVQVRSQSYFQVVPHAHSCHILCGLVAAFGHCPRYIRPDKIIMTSFVRIVHVTVRHVEIQLQYGHKIQELKAQRNRKKNEGFLISYVRARCAEGFTTNCALALLKIFYLILTDQKVYMSSHHHHRFHKGKSPPSKSSNERLKCCASINRIPCKVFCFGVFS